MFDRVQMLIEPPQHRALKEIAQRQGKSVAEVTRQVIDLGLKHLKSMGEFDRRAEALRRADLLKAKVIQQNVELPDSVAVLDGLRQERLDELTAELIHRD
jgi:hypothetical protein